MSCNGTSVGALVLSADGKKYLGLMRKKRPAKLALIAGHGEEGVTPQVQCSKELHEECGIKIDPSRFSLVKECHLDNPCSKKEESGHYWWFYEVKLTAAEEKLVFNAEPEKHEYLFWHQIGSLVNEKKWDPAWVMSGFL